MLTSKAFILTSFLKQANQSLLWQPAPAFLSRSGNQAPVSFPRVTVGRTRESYFLNTHFLSTEPLTAGESDEWTYQKGRWPSTPALCRTWDDRADLAPADTWLWRGVKGLIRKYSPSLLSVWNNCWFIKANLMLALQIWFISCYLEITRHKKEKKIAHIMWFLYIACRVIFPVSVIISTWGHVPSGNG